VQKSFEKWVLTGFGPFLKPKGTLVLLSGIGSVTAFCGVARPALDGAEVGALKTVGKVEEEAIGLACRVDGREKTGGRVVL
jgi:hypothetical protein